jgi:hypothetical protein
MFIRRQGFPGVGPSVRMGQALSVVLDELDDLVLQGRHGREVAAAEQFADERPEADFDLVQP